MLPIRDHLPTRRAPLVTWLLMAINIAVFFYQRFGASSPLQLVGDWGFVPALVFSAPLTHGVTAITSMFLHGGWMHLAGNMLFLWIFGDNVEDRLGRGRYLAFYLLAGLVGALVQGLVAPSSTIPLIGASGAIAGVLAAYVRLFPGARVTVLIPTFFFAPFFQLPAWLVIGEWFLIQIVSGLFGGAGSGVAFFAHIGGFLAGLLSLGWFVERRRRFATQPQPQARYVYRVSTPTSDPYEGWRPPRQRHLRWRFLDGGRGLLPPVGLKG